jgi:integrase
MSRVQRRPDQGHEFASTVGTSLEPSNVTHQLHRLLPEAELLHHRFQDVRLSSAPLHISQFVLARVVKDTLGYSQPSLTLGTNSDVMLASRRKTGQTIGRDFGC